VSGLFDELVSFDNLYLAYLKARKGKRFVDYVLLFEKDLEENLLCLQKDLFNGCYVHGVYREMIVNDSKKRLNHYLIKSLFMILMRVEKIRALIKLLIDCKVF